MLTYIIISIIIAALILLILKSNDEEKEKYFYQIAFLIWLFLWPLLLTLSIVKYYIDEKEEK